MYIASLFYFSSYCYFTLQARFAWMNWLDGKDGGWAHLWALAWLCMYTHWLFLIRLGGLDGSSFLE